MDAELTGSQFDRPANFDLATYWQTWRNRFEDRQNSLQVTLRVAPSSGPLLALVFGEGIVALLAASTVEDTAGHSTIALTFDSIETACRQLLGLGTAVEVLAPQTLRQMMQEQASQVLRQYQAK